MSWVTVRGMPSIQLKYLVIRENSLGSAGKAYNQWKYLVIRGNSLGSAGKLTISEIPCDHREFLGISRKSFQSMIIPCDQWEYPFGALYSHMEKS